jgi:hypothetical protein
MPLEVLSRMITCSDEQGCIAYYDESGDAATIAAKTTCTHNQGTGPK